MICCLRLIPHWGDDAHCGGCVTTHAESS
jgi:hypothetical protein